MFLEKKYGIELGLDLTSAVLLAINKYPYCIEEEGNNKGLYRQQWNDISQLRKNWGIPDGKATLEAQLMDLCDDIAYSTHDIEDGIRAGKITMSPHLFENNRLINEVVIEVEKERKKDQNVWNGIDILKEIGELLEKYYEEWSNICRDCEFEYSRARREMKARWVNKFATSIGVIEDNDGKRLRLLMKVTQKNKMCTYIDK